MELTIKQRLEALGLGKNEASVYLAALSRGESTIGDLVHETQLHKQLIYDSAEKLQKEGLMTISQVSSRRHFAAADPSVLEQRIEQRLTAVRGLLPALYKVASSKKEKDLVRTYHGLAAVQLYYQQSMRTQPEHEEVLVTGVGGQRFFELWGLNNPFFKKFEDARTSRNIPLKLLFFIPGKEDVPNLPGIANRKDLEARVVKDSNQSPIDIVVWSTHVSLLLYGSTPHMIDIAGDHMVAAFRVHFELTWKQGQKIQSQNT